MATTGVLVRVCLLGGSASEGVHMCSTVQEARPPSGRDFWPIYMSLCLVLKNFLKSATVVITSNFTVRA